MSSRAAKMLALRCRASSKQGKHYRVQKLSDTVHVGVSPSVTFPNRELPHRQIVGHIALHMGVTVTCWVLGVY